MADHQGAIKAHRQNLARRGRNRSGRSRLRTAVKALRSAIAEGEADEARGLLVGTLSLLDLSARHGAINDNKAARTKSRLTRAVNKLQ